MTYRLFGWWYRWQAAKLAAQAIANRPEDDRRQVFNFAVFFETYMTEGANATAEFFGAEIVELKEVSKPE